MYGYTTTAATITLPVAYTTCYSGAICRRYITWKGNQETTVNHNTVSSATSMGYKGLTQIEIHGIETKNGAVGMMYLLIGF